MYLKGLKKKTVKVSGDLSDSLYKAYFILGHSTSLWASLYLQKKVAADFLQSSFQLKIISQSEGGESN